MYFYCHDADGNIQSMIPFDKREKREKRDKTSLAKGCQERRDNVKKYNRSVP